MMLLAFLRQALGLLKKSMDPYGGNDCSLQTGEGVNGDSDHCP